MINSNNYLPILDSRHVETIVSTRKVYSTSLKINELSPRRIFSYTENLPLVTTTMLTCFYSEGKTVHNIILLLCVHIAIIIYVRFHGGRMFETDRIFCFLFPLTRVHIADRKQQHRNFVTSKKKYAYGLE